MKLILTFSLILSLALGVTQSAAAAEQSTLLAQQKGQSKFISQRDVEAAGGYKLSVPGRGVFKVIRVGSSKNPDKKCLVEEASLRRLIANGQPANPAITIELRAYTGGTCPSDSICCKGSGSGCSVEVVIVQKPSGGGND